MHNKTLNALIQRAGKFVQAENAEITYTVNWAAYLETGAVSTSTWTAEDSGLTIANTSAEPLLAATVTNLTASGTGIRTETANAGGAGVGDWLALTMDNGTVEYREITSASPGGSNTVFSFATPLGSQSSSGNAVSFFSSLTVRETSARLSGSPGSYRAVNKIVTLDGDTYERYVDLTIKDNSSGYQSDYGN